jgi:hypothetical protein
MTQLYSDNTGCQPFIVRVTHRSTYIIKTKEQRAKVKNAQNRQEKDLLTHYPSEADNYVEFQIWQKAQ